jgi:hypothetical protein
VKRCHQKASTSAPAQLELFSFVPASLLRYVLQDRVVVVATAP